MTPVREPGSFKAIITDYGLVESKEKAVGITIKAQLYEQWRPDQESGGHWDECNYEAEGVLWVVKKNGDANEPAVESLVNHAGWDASLISIESGSWSPAKCQVTIKSNTYEGKTRLQIAFVNSINRTPTGGMSNISKDRAKELEAEFGSKLRPHGAPVVSSQIGAPPGRDNDVPF